MRKQRKWIYTALYSICMALFLITVPASAAETEKEVSTAKDLTDALADSDISEIRLAGDIDISSTLEVDRTVTLDLNGFVLQMTGQKSVIKVESSGDLTIQDSNASVPHRFTPNTDGLWELDETNGTETVSGGVITGGVASETTLVTEYFVMYCGGGVYIAEGGKLTMTDGNIVGCSAQYFGGGVVLEKNTSFTMSGGSIAGCTSGSGGGISCYSDGNRIDMSGTALIRDCRAKESGGGIWIYGELHMTDAAAIRGCIAGNAGGGVYVNSASSLVMSGNAVIEDCKAVNDEEGYWAAKGGGTYIANGASLIMSGDTSVLNCSAERSDGSPSSYGGGVSANVAEKITLEGNALIDQGKAANKIGLYIEGSNQSGYGNIYANGGSINGDVILGDAENAPCTIAGTGKTTFNGTVTVQPGSKIENGTFNGTVINNGAITGGTFTDTVVNNGAITGGEFTTIINNESGTTAEGVSVSHPKFIVTFDNGGVTTTETVDKDSKLTEPTIPAKEGYLLDGWYYNNNGAKTKWDFDTDKVKSSMTLTAQWAESIPYIVEHYKATGNGYTLEETEHSAGKIGDTVTAVPKTYTGFTYHPSISTSSGILKKISSEADKVTLKLYYDRTVYTVTVENGGNGSASAAPVSATMGEEIILTATPDSGYHFKEWQIISGGVTISNNKFTMPADNVTVKAIFEKTSGGETSNGGASSGGGGGSGGGAAPTTSTTIPVSGEAGTIRITVTINGTTATISEIDPAELEKVIGKTGVVKIDLSGLNMDIDRVNLPTNSIKVIVNAAEHAHNDTVALAVVFRHGTVTLDKKTMQAVVNQTKGSLVRLVLDDTGTAQLNNTQKTAIARTVARIAMWIMRHKV